MSLANDLLTDVKQHLRISHTLDDDLILNEIQVSINNIYTQYLLMDPPTDIADVSDNVKLAVKHSVAQLRENPDGILALSTRVMRIDDRLIRKILGSERNY